MTRMGRDRLRARSPKAIERGPEGRPQEEMGPRAGYLVGRLDVMFRRSEKESLLNAERARMDAEPLEAEGGWNGQRGCGRRPKPSGVWSESESRVDSLNLGLRSAVRA